MDIRVTRRLCLFDPKTGAEGKRTKVHSCRFCEVHTAQSRNFAFLTTALTASLGL